MIDRCAECGHPRAEHTYNGACYGLCGEFVPPRSEVQSREAIARIIAPATWDQYDKRVAFLGKAPMEPDVRERGIEHEKGFCQSSLDKADAILALGVAQASWMPIETAPKDGTQIIGLWWSDNSVGEPPMKHIGICVWAGAWIPHQRKLTHWHSVPDTSSVPSADREAGK